MPDIKIIKGHLTKIMVYSLIISLLMILPQIYITYEKHKLATIYGTAPYLVNTKTENIVKGDIYKTAHIILLTTVSTEIYLCITQEGIA